MNLIDKLYDQLEMIEYKIDCHRNGELELSEREIGILLGKESIIHDLIEDVENGNFD